MPTKPKLAQFRPTTSTRAQFDKGVGSASPGSQCGGPSIPERATARQPGLGLVSPMPLRHARSLCYYSVVPHAA